MTLTDIPSADTQDARAAATAPDRPRPKTAARRPGVRGDRKMGPNSFVPRHSSPFQEHTLRLGSLMAQQLFHNTYGRTQVALYNVRFLAPMLADEQTARELAGTVRSMLDNIREELSEGLHQLRLLRQQKGAPSAVSFSAPEETTVQWFTPATHKYLLLIEDFDALMAEIETLWMYEHFDDEQKRSIGYEWRNRLIRFARSLIDLQGRSLEAVRRKLSKGRGGDGARRDGARKAVAEAPAAAADAAASETDAGPIDAAATPARGRGKTRKAAADAVAPESVVDAGATSANAAALVGEALDAVDAEFAASTAPQVSIEVVAGELANAADLDAVVSGVADTGAELVELRPRKRSVAPPPAAEDDVVPAPAFLGVG